VSSAVTIGVHARDERPRTSTNFHELRSARTSAAPEFQMITVIYDAVADASSAGHSTRAREASAHVREHA
jgi:hypothetical protein